MSRVTPFFSMTASSSFFTSSKVKPYWKPEQPPPVTNTRSLSSGLPSSSINCLTLFAALSLKTSGVGISVTAFIICSWLCARGELQLDTLHLGAMMHQPAFNHSALMDFDALIVHIAFDPRPSLEFERLRSMNRAMNGAIDDNVRRQHFAIDPRICGHHQGAGLVGEGRDVPAHHAVDTQPATEDHVAVDARRRADQAVDAVLRLALLFVEHFLSPLQRHAVRRARLAGTGLVDTRLDGLHLRLGVDSESAFHAAEVLERQPERRRPCIGRLREAHHSILPPSAQCDD